MLTAAERERAHAEAVQVTRDNLVLERLDKIIELLIEIRDNTASAGVAPAEASSVLLPGE